MSLLTIEGLRVEFDSPDGRRGAVKNVSLSVDHGEVLGLIGESGSGKSLTCRAVMRLINPPGRVAGGDISFDGRDVLAMSRRELLGFRAREVGMIYQDPYSSLNPVFRVGTQLSETLRHSLAIGRSEARKRGIELLDRVGIPNPSQRYLAYPHELSGGMRQRVMIALATAASPRLLLADEPTTALDVTTQEQILALLASMRREFNMGMVLVSHDFGVISQMCDRVAVMYGGHVVETGPMLSIYDDPQHPYTRALLESVPDLDSAGRVRRRQAIGGQPPELTDVVLGCVFAPRCRYAAVRCKSATMELEPITPDHATACPVRPFGGLASGREATIKADV